MCWEVNAPGKSAGSYQYLLRPNKKTEIKIRSTLVKEVFYQNMKFNRDSSDLVCCQLLSSLFLPSVFVISNFLYVHFSSAFQRHSCDWRETCVLSCNWHYDPELGIGSALSPARLTSVVYSPAVGAWRKFCLALSLVCKFPAQNPVSCSCPRTP